MRPGWASSLPRAWNNSRRVLRLGTEVGLRLDRASRMRLKSLGFILKAVRGLGEVFSSRVIFLARSLWLLR